MLQGMVTEITTQFWLVSAVFLRIGPAMFFAPGFGENFLPVQVRLLAAITLSAAAAPALQPYLPSGFPEKSDLFGFALRETTFGFFIGLISRAMIFLVEKAGAVISQSVSLAQMLGYTTEPMPVMSHILTTTALAIVFSTTLADQMVYAFFASYYAQLPTLSEITGFFAQKSLEATNYVFKHGVVLASGFVSAFFVYYLAIGFINKAMPQFMVSFIGIPFVALYSIYFLHQHAEFILTVWQEKALTILLMPFEGAK